MTPMCPVFIFFASRQNGILLSNTNGCNLLTESRRSPLTFGCLTARLERTGCLLLLLFFVFWGFFFCFVTLFKMSAEENLSSTANEQSSFLINENTPSCAEWSSLTPKL